MIILLIFLLCSSCSSNEGEMPPSGQKIERKHNNHVIAIAPQEKRNIEPYPWKKGTYGQHPHITKEYFRCKGSSLNPVRIEQGENGTTRYYDCGGPEKHSLQLREGKEFVYPVLIELLNEIQEKTGNKVVITCGHRCPDHNNYSDPSKENQYSKHMIGAEVSFYVQGMEYEPQKIVKLLMDHYGGSEQFQRYEKQNTNVTIHPWYNKEIFIKLFKSNEGRNFDNRHPYPYISIQVRWDRDLNEWVSYSWPKAHRNYHRR